MVAVNAPAPAMMTRPVIIQHQERDMPPSANAQSSPEAHAGAVSPDERDLGALAVAATLGAAQVLCAQLSACARLQATIEPTPQGRARAAFLHAAARFLRQACLVLDPRAGSNERRDPATRLIHRDADHPVACLPPAALIDEQAMLAEALSALASQSAALATQAKGPMAAVLKSIQACTGAAAGQLRAAEAFSPPVAAGPDSLGPVRHGDPL
jgi:hypothetical protein